MWGTKSNDPTHASGKLATELVTPSRRQRNHSPRHGKTLWFIFASLEVSPFRLLPFLWDSIPFVIESLVSLLALLEVRVRLLCFLC